MVSASAGPPMISYFCVVSSTLAAHGKAGGAAGWPTSVKLGDHASGRCRTWRQFPPTGGPDRGRRSHQALFAACRLLPAPAEEIGTKDAEIEKGDGPIEMRSYTASFKLSRVVSEGSIQVMPRFTNIKRLVRVFSRIEYADRCCFETRDYIAISSHCRKCALSWIRCRPMLQRCLCASRAAV
jgi:hypothetical protein